MAIPDAGAARLYVDWLRFNTAALPFDMVALPFDMFSRSFNLVLLPLSPAIRSEWFLANRCNSDPARVDIFLVLDTPINGGDSRYESLGRTQAACLLYPFTATC
jgi:hypothetical protein